MQNTQVPADGVVLFVIVSEYGLCVFRPTPLLR